MKIVGDVSGLPDTAFGPRNVIWWGILGFILIEGTAFVLGGGSYLFLMGHTTPWPPNGRAPAIWAGLLFTVVALLSEWPNVWTDKVAHALRLGPTRTGLVIMSLIGVALVVIRGFEFAHLNVRWDDNAYGSIVWALMILHTTHVVTDLADTVVITVFCFTHEVDEERFSDITDNCMYWHFVVLAWLPLYGLVYWMPRLVS
jgi:cytochrome c oxidase subunit 3